MIMVLIIMLVVVAADYDVYVVNVVRYICCFRCRICLEWTLLKYFSSLYMTIGDW